MEYAFEEKRRQDYFLSEYSSDFYGSIQLFAVYISDKEYQPRGLDLYCTFGRRAFFLSDVLMQDI